MARTPKQIAQQRVAAKASADKRRKHGVGQPIAQATQQPVAPTHRPGVPTSSGSGVAKPAGPHAFSSPNKAPASSVTVSKPSTYWKNRSKSPSAFQSSGRYAAPIQVKGKKGAAYDVQTRKRKSKGY